MKSRWARCVLSFSLMLLLVVVSTPVESRRGGARGGGHRGMSRRGPASHGSVRARPQHRSPTRSTRREPSRVERREPSRVERREPSRVERTERREVAGGETAVDRANRIADKDLEERRDHREDRLEEGQDRRDEIRDDRQDYVDDVRDDRKDYADDVRDDREDWYDDHYRHGTVRVYTRLPCTAETVVVGGKTYYRCSSTWYARTFSGGDVTYAVVGAPSGY